jgi:hypothetical protein
MRPLVLLAAAAGCGHASPAGEPIGATAKRRGAVADVPRCPDDRDVDALIRSHYPAPPGPAERVACLAVRLGGPRWFLEGRYPDPEGAAVHVLLVDAITRDVVWRDPYGGVAMPGVPAPRRTVIDLDGDGRDEIVEVRGYPEGDKTLAVLVWTDDEGWVGRGQIVPCGVTWPTWRAEGAALAVSCATSVHQYRWTDEELEEVDPGAHARAQSAR